MRRFHFETEQFDLADFPGMTHDQAVAKMVEDDVFDGRDFIFVACMLELVDDGEMYYTILYAGSCEVDLNVELHGEEYPEDE